MALAGHEFALPEVAVVDDSRALQLAWTTRLRGQARVHVFDRPQALWTALDDQPELGLRLCAAVIDGRFSNSKEDGVSLAVALRARAPHVRRVLSSCGTFTEEELQVFDLVIDKTPVPFSELTSLTQSTR